MDLAELISHLKEQHARCLQAIELLEQLEQGGSPGRSTSRRGRKSMGQKERGEVSVRMRRYWQNRREARAIERLQQQAGS